MRDEQIKHLLHEMLYSIYWNDFGGSTDDFIKHALEVNSKINHDITPCTTQAIDELVSYIKLNY